MVIVELYKDLLKEIDILEWLFEDLERQMQRNHSECYGHEVPLPKALAKYDNINERMKGAEAELKIKYNLKNKIEAGLKKMEGIHYKVAFARDIEGKSLREIAHESGYSHIYVKKISAKIDKIMTTV